MSRLTTAVVAVALIGAVGGCGSRPAAAPPASAAGAAPSPIALPSCPPSTAKPYRWPSPVPADLPIFPGAVLGPTRHTASGLTVVPFSTSGSLRDGVLFIVRQFPAAGFTLGRGDAEAAEADAPFSKGTLRGVLRGSAVQLCQTQWLLAVTRGTTGGTTGNPLLPTRPTPSPSPLPFG